VPLGTSRCRSSTMPISRSGHVLYGPTRRRCARSCCRGRTGAPCRGFSTGATRRRSRTGSRMPRSRRRGRRRTAAYRPKDGARGFAFPQSASSVSKFQHRELAASHVGGARGAGEFVGIARHVAQGLPEAGLIGVDHSRPRRAHAHRDGADEGLHRQGDRRRIRPTDRHQPPVSSVTRRVCGNAAPRSNALLRT